MKKNEFWPKADDGRAGGKTDPAYGGFNLEKGAFEPVSADAVMLENRRIAPFLSDAHLRTGVDRARNIGYAALSVFLAVLFALVGNWSIFKRASLPEPEAPELPARFASSAPAALAGRVARINDFIDQNNWKSTQDNLRTLLAESAGDESGLADDPRRWALTELLVLSNLLHDKDFQEVEQYYEGLLRLAAKQGAAAPPYRAMLAYARRVADYYAGSYDRILPVLEHIRAEYSGLMDASAFLLKNEAECHIRLLPTWREKGTERSDRWRGANRALAALRRLVGENDEIYLALELEKWTVALRCFYPWPIGGDAITMANATYAKAAVEEQVRKYRQSLAKARGGT